MGLRPAAWRLNGSSWRPVRFPGRPGETVTAGPSDVWVFAQPGDGSGGPRAAWHYDGHAWHRVTGAAGLDSAAVVAADDIWAFGGSRIGHWDGTSWTSTSLAARLPRAGRYCAPAITAIYPQSPDNAWALGWQGCQDTGGTAVLLRDTAGHWSRVASLGQVDPVAVFPTPRGGVLVLTGSDPQQGGHPAVLQEAGGRLSTLRVPLLHGIQVWSAFALPDSGGVLVTGTRPGPGGTVIGVLLRYRVRLQAG